MSFGTLAALAIERVALDDSPASLPTGITLLSNSEINEIRFYNNSIQALFVTGDCEFNLCANLTTNFQDCVCSHLPLRVPSARCGND
jgi:hypothetical protein